MTFFSVRLEQHRMRDYNEQHAVLHGIGLLRYVMGTNGKWYALPTGEYFGSFVGKSADEVRRMAVAAVATFWPGEPAIYCDQIVDSSFSGLTLVSPADLDKWDADMRLLKQKMEQRLKPALPLAPAALGPAPRRPLLSSVHPTLPASRVAPLNAAVPIGPKSSVLGALSRFHRMRTSGE
jgi:hypothetical protein